MRFLPPAIVIGAFALLVSSSAMAQSYSCTPSNFSVQTSQYNNQRTGANTSETCLTPTNVGGGTMAEQIQLLTPDAPNTCLSTTNAANCCSASWSGSGYNPVYAQPLYVYQATVTGASGGKANIVIVATLTDQVFAYDATATQSTTNPCNSSVAWGTWYWVRNLLAGGSSGDCYSTDGPGVPIPQPGPAIPAAKRQRKIVSKFLCWVSQSA